MINLNPYKEYFPQAYTKYDDDPYSDIHSLVQKLPTNKSAIDLLESSDAQKILKLIRSLIFIKNYKSTIPFPEKFEDAIRLIVKIKNTRPKKPISKSSKALLKELLDTEGFQLPTASAVFHFCHPEHYPIVDTNVETAIGIILKIVTMNLPKKAPLICLLQKTL